MPIYEYRCSDCGKTIEAIQKFSDEPYVNCGQTSVVCDKKGEGPIERQLTAPTFQFKGSGFYITDYANGKKAAAEAKAGGGGESSSDSKGDTKSEAKSDSKSDTKSESKPDSKADSKSEPAKETKPSDSKSAASTKSDT